MREGWAHLSDGKGETEIHDPDNHGGDAVVFKVAGNQTHGLVTNWSQRNKQHDIDAVFLGPLQNLFCVRAAPALGVLGWYAIKSGSDRTN